MSLHNRRSALHLLFLLLLSSLRSIKGARLVTGGLDSRVSFFSICPPENRHADPDSTNLFNRRSVFPLPLV